MSATAFIVTALLAQSAFPLAAEGQWQDSTEVGYEELASGQPQAAIAKIEASQGTRPDDPGALINMGNAHARLGQTDKAIEYYRTAIASDVRYELELADGRWMDSRRAAREALRALLKNQAQAMRQ